MQASRALIQKKVATNIMLAPRMPASGSVISRAAKIPVTAFHFAWRVTAPMPNNAPQDTKVAQPIYELLSGTDLEWHVVAWGAFGSRALWRS